MDDPGRACSGIDNLSRLPDDILSRILSLLCTEDAVRTSVLSKRWRYLYTSISNLTLDFNSQVHKNIDDQDCMNFVDRFLFHRKKCVIDKFKLKWKMSRALDPLRLENWIKVVLGHGIRELDLSIYDFELKDLLLPYSLFTSKTLEVLKLNIWAKSDYPSTNSEARDDYLELPSKLVVSSPTLKRLTIDLNNGCFNVVVDAPSLVYLGFSTGDTKSLKFVNAQSLVETNIGNIGGEISRFINVANELMRVIRNIQKLRICDATLFHFVFLAIPIPMLHNMIHLTIYDCYLGLAALPNLLEKCESLETLVLEDICKWRSDKWTSVEESRIRCLSSAVKTIKVCRFKGEENEVGMVKYFLETARVLELIEIHLDSKCRNPSEISTKLQMLPKNSEALMNIIF